jgi:hypothetical protein
MLCKNKSMKVALEDAVNYFGKLSLNMLQLCGLKSYTISEKVSIYDKVTLQAYES